MVAGHDGDVCLGHTESVVLVRDGWHAGWRLAYWPAGGHPSSDGPSSVCGKKGNVLEVFGRDHHPVFLVGVQPTGISSGEWLLPVGALLKTVAPKAFLLCLY